MHISYPFSTNMKLTLFWLTVWFWPIWIISPKNKHINRKNKSESDNPGLRVCMKWACHMLQVVCIVQRPLLMHPWLLLRTGGNTGCFGRLYQGPKFLERNRFKNPSKFGRKGAKVSPSLIFYTFLSLQTCFDRVHSNNSSLSVSLIQTHLIAAVDRFLLSLEDFELL